MKAVASGKVECDFRGLAMGDSWISPVDSTLTWGPYLYATVSILQIFRGFVKSCVNFSIICSAVDF